MRKRLMGLAVVVVVLLVGAGVATGASRYLLTSTHQIKPNVLQALRSNDRGKTGARGNAGPAGTRGTAGGFSTTNVTQATGASAVMCPAGDGGCVIGSSLALCPAGSVAFGGGWDGENSPPVDATSGYDKPAGTNGWEVIMANNSSIDATFHAVVTCGAAGSSGQAQSAAAPAPTAGQQHQLADDLAAARRSR